MEANTSQRKWWIVCDCDGKGCPECDNTGRKHPERCPVYYYTNELNTLRYLYGTYKHKYILPFNGSPIDQPSVLFKAFNMIDYYLNIRENTVNAEKEKTQGVVSKLMRRKNG